jgi:hypothetical protein
MMIMPTMCSSWTIGNWRRFQCCRAILTMLQRYDFDKLFFDCSSPDVQCTYMKHKFKHLTCCSPDFEVGNIVSDKG